MKNYYRVNQIQLVSKPSRWSLFLDRLFGYRCNCPDCPKDKRPVLWSKHHGYWKGLIPWCLFGKHNIDPYEGTCTVCAYDKELGY